MLRVERLSRTFGALEAVSDLTLEIPDGALYGLIGPNGSGKTTLFNVVTGLYPPTSGRILLDHQDITAAAASRRVRLGIARTFQNLRIYPRMSVFDNVWVAQHALPEVGLTGLLFPNRAAERRRRDRVDELLELAELHDRREQLAGTLPLAEQRRLELVRAIARSPRLLLLDEPAGGMNPAETEAMASLIRTVAAPGRTCIVIEHKMDMIQSLCPQICVLNFGAKIAEGTPGEVFSDAGVLEAYLGYD